MNKITGLLSLLMAGCGIAQIALPATNTATANRILMIDPSSMPVGVGSATLIIGALRRTDGVYSGDYKIKVFPYFLKNEAGHLAIIVSDESLAAVNAGKIAAITGTATTDGKGGKIRPIDATATPSDINRGKLKLWFTAGDRKMIFEPTYHFVEAGTTAMVPRTSATTIAAGQPCRVAASHTQDQETATRHL